MIAVDIETTGLVPGQNSILSIGAVCLQTGQEFYQECKADPGTQVSDFAMQLNGLHRLLTNGERHSLELYRNFYDWAKHFEDRTLLVCNVAFDLAWLRHLHVHAGFSLDDFLFRRNVDLYSLSWLAFGEPLSLAKLCDRLGIQQEPAEHNALHGARKNAEALRSLLQSLDTCGICPDLRQI